MVRQAEPIPRERQPPPEPVRPARLEPSSSSGSNIREPAVNHPLPPLVRRQPEPPRVVQNPFLPDRARPQPANDPPRREERPNEPRRVERVPSQDSRADSESVSQASSRAAVNGLDSLYSRVRNFANNSFRSWMMESDDNSHIDMDEHARRMVEAFQFPNYEDRLRQLQSSN